jgi:hypothetical protein
MILKHELAGERSIAVQRHGRRAVQFFMGKSTDCRGRGGAVSRQQCKRGFFGDSVIRFCVIVVYRVNSVPSNTCDRLSGSE